MKPPTCAQCGESISHVPSNTLDSIIKSYANQPDRTVEKAQRQKDRGGWEHYRQSADEHHAPAPSDGRTAEMEMARKTPFNYRSIKQGQS